tara:strand:- start:81 stop:506 length:426 start_codon:yes stop_codon:yes gene_type:complete
MEVVMVLFLLILVSFAMFQFTTAMIIKQTVVHSATVGAREAAKDPDIDELADIVDKVLAVHNIEIGTDASIVLEDPAATLPVQKKGTLTCDPPIVPVLEPDEVRVTICVSFSAAAFMNPLKSYGADFTGKKFTISSVAKKE